MENVINGGAIIMTFIIIGLILFGVKMPVSSHVKNADGSYSPVQKSLIKSLMDRDIF